MDEQRSGAVDATTEPAAESPAAEQSKPSFADILLQTALDDGHTVRGMEPPKAETEPETEETEPELPIEEPPTEEETPEEVETPAEGTDAEPVKHDQWPESARKRVAEITAKRNERTQERDRAIARAQQAEAEVQKLQAQLASAVAPLPTPDNPFSDIYDPNQLVKFEKDYQDIRAAAEKILVKPSEYLGDDDKVGFGKDANGNEIRLSLEELVDAKLRAERAVNQAIPARKSFIAAQREANEKAIMKYPDYKDPNSDMTKETIAIVRQNPRLESVLGPDALIIIARYLKGLQLENQSNGKAPDAVTRIAAAAKAKIAPTPTKPRSPVERRSSGADLARATQKLEERKDFDSAVEFVGATFAQRGKAKRLQPIGE